MYDFLFYQTKIPKQIISSLIVDLRDNILDTNNLKEGLIGTENTSKKQRDSKIEFINSNLWISGFIYYYILQANEINYNYDISGYSNSCIQYSEYTEGCFYDWHIDYQGGAEKTVVDRKLSFSLQLSEPDEYEGGELQLMDSCTNKTYFAPKNLGTIVIFDSKIKHRVRKVKSGCRKSLVGWVVGPKFR